MLRHLFFCSVAMLVAVTVRSSELSASVELELLANKLLGEEQPLQSAEDQLAGIQSRLNDERRSGEGALQHGSGLPEADRTCHVEVEEHQGEARSLTKANQPSPCWRPTKPCTVPAAIG